MPISFQSLTGEPCRTGAEGSLHSQALGKFRDLRAWAGPRKPGYRGPAESLLLSAETESRRGSGVEKAISVLLLPYRPDLLENHHRKMLLRRFVIARLPRNRWSKSTRSARKQIGAVGISGSASWPLPSQATDNKYLVSSGIPAMFWHSLCNYYRRGCCQAARNDFSFGSAQENRK